jgi:hypothetical protein
VTIRLIFVVVDIKLGSRITSQWDDLSHAYLLEVDKARVDKISGMIMKEIVGLDLSTS